MTPESYKNKNSLILSLDVSQERTGVALMDGDICLKYGAFKVAKTGLKTSSPKFIHVLDDYFCKISEIIEKFEKKYCKIDYYVMEDLNIKFNPAGKLLTQFQAAAKIAISQADGRNEVHLINNMTVKSKMGVITRKKLIPDEIIKLSKEHKVLPVKIQMVDKVRELGYKLGYDQHDEADAIAQAVVWYRYRK